MLKTAINTIKEMVNNGVVSKKEFSPILGECDILMQSFLKAKDYHYTCPSNLFHQTTDERLQQILDKQKEAVEHPETVIQEVSQNLLQVFDSFISRYKIGFIHDAKMENTGFANVEIACLITSGFSDGKRESARQKLEMQMDFLRNEGFIIEHDKHNYYVKTCGQNEEKLFKLLSERGARLITIKSREDKIDKINFRVAAKDIKNFQCEEITFELPVSENLNKDEQIAVTRCCNEIMSTLNMMPAMTNIKDTCCSVMESYFAEICDVFDFDCETRKSVKNRHAEERSKNIKIREMEKSFADCIDADKIKEILYPLKEKLSMEVLRKTGFVIDELSIGKYGNINISFLYSTCPLLYMEDTDAIAKTICDTFDHNSGDAGAETLYLLDTYENKDKLENILYEIIPTIRLMEFNSSKVDRKYCIKKFSGCIDTILPVIKKVAL
jgi:hypothetical protein